MRALLHPDASENERMWRQISSVASPCDPGRPALCRGNLLIFAAVNQALGISVTWTELAASPVADLYLRTSMQLNSCIEVEVADPLLLPFLNKLSKLLEPEGLVCLSLFCGQALGPRRYTISNSPTRARNLLTSSVPKEEYQSYDSITVVTDDLADSVPGPKVQWVSWGWPASFPVTRPPDRVILQCPVAEDCVQAILKAYQSKISSLDLTMGTDYTNRQDLIREFARCLGVNVKLYQSLPLCLDEEIFSPMVHGLDHNPILLRFLSLEFLQFFQILAEIQADLAKKQSLD